MPEKKTAEKAPAFNEDEAMAALLKQAIPKGLQERVKELEEEHESNFRLHPDEVAVMDISTAQMSLTDVVPGFYDVVTGSVRDKEVRGEDAKAEFTKQYLRITDRYEVVLNPLPVTERIHKITVVPRKEWEEHIKGKAAGMVTTEQEVAGQMLRAGGSV